MNLHRRGDAQDRDDAARGKCMAFLFRDPRLRAANALAVLSFALFALGVLSLHQERSIPFVIEEGGPFPAALSHYLYGAKRGFASRDLTSFFQARLRSQPAEEMVEHATHDDIKSEHGLTLMDDGNGIGAILMPTVAFALFGIHAHALPYFFVLILGISAGIFILRFQDRRIFAIPVLFTAFTALLLSPLINLPNLAQQGPIGGVRSYAIVPILAALHWCFEISADSPAQRRDRVLRRIYLGAQLGILVFAILVRGSPMYLLGPVFATWLYYLRRGWGWAGIRTGILRVIVPTIALFVVLHSIPRVLFPDHVRANRAFTVVWHRVFISFGAHPAWPFAGLREKYPCPVIPEELLPGIVDRNGHCVWFSYVNAHHIPIGQASLETYDDAYDAVLRSAVWYVARTYPKETLEVFLVLKPQLILRNELAMLSLHAPHGGRLPWVVLALQCAILIVFMVGWPPDSAFADMACSAGLLSPFLLLGILPQLIAWAKPFTAIDFNAYVSCALILGVWLIVAVAMALVGRRSMPRLETSGP